MARRSFSIAFAAACLGLLALAAGPAEAKYTDEIIAPQDGTSSEGWQAGVCEVELECNPESPATQFSTQAAQHPKFGFTQFIVKDGSGPLVEPVGNLKDVRVDLPVGLSVDPQAVEQCPLATFESASLTCPAGAAVGTSLITLAVAGLPIGPVPAAVYDLVPNQGEPALFGFEPVPGTKVFLKADVEWAGDYHEGFTIAVAKAPTGSIYKNRLVFFGTSGGTFLTNPSTCHDPTKAPFEHTYSTFLKADSYEVEDPKFPEGAAAFEAPLPTGVKPTGCAQVPFKPTIGVAPGTQTTDSPDGATVSVGVPFDPKQAIANSNVKTARLSLPLGMGLNPASADQLSFCTDAELNKGSRAPVTCPVGSKIGSVAIETPPLPAGSLKGDVFLGKQLSRDPTSGNEYRIFVDAESSRYGVSVRLVGRVSADPATGRLTTTLAENPQVPFTSFKLTFNKGSKAVLTSAPSCGPNTSTSQITPYTETADATPSQSFKLTKAPGGGGCPATRGARPFSPGFSTSSKTNRARAFDSFAIHITRDDGQQEIKGTDFRLPPGITGKLKGVPYCPAKSLEAASRRAGRSEAKSASCPAKSLLGSASIKAGSGGSPSPTRTRRSRWR
jgi:hypothetical protein